MLNCRVCSKDEEMEAKALLKFNVLLMLEDPVKKSGMPSRN
jgi:hypothetical protein